MVMDVESSDLFDCEQLSTGCMSMCVYVCTKYLGGDNRELQDWTLPWSSGELKPLQSPKD